MKRPFFLGSLLIIEALLISCGAEEQINSDKQTLFQLISPAKSNIDFINSVSDQESFNILTYRNFYNGGGVAVGDINNDGLSDIFFTSNLQTCKLYLNKGNFVFEDISEMAGIGGKRGWSTGVTMADVNADGWLDIYVCNSGDIKGDDKENELFINNKNLTFTEKGAEYNLNNKGLSTQASFFDYDLDGDLDCYILNNSFIAPDKIELFKNVRTEIDDLGGDKLYRNDGGHFVDVTAESGIYSSKIGFGLGVSVSDINNDRLPDIYISNDFWERDYLYINQGNGKFKERLTELLSICSVSSMGADIADINNDGNPEIFTTDMLAADNYRLKAMTIFDNYQLSDIKYRGSYHYQILQNCLHLNNGNLNFQEIASFSNVYASDWSWGALIFDFQNDGLNDIFVSNGITKDIMYVDFTDFISDKDNIKKIVTEKGRFDWRDFIPYIPSNPIKSFGFVNQGNLIFKNQSDSLGLGDPSFSNGAAYADLDNDGDLDLVVNNVNMPAFVYQNQSAQITSNHYLKFSFKGDSLNRFGIGASVKLFTGNEIRLQQNFPSRGFQSSVEPYLNFGLGKIDSIERAEIAWPDGKIQILQNIKVDQLIAVDIKNASSPMGSPSSTDTSVGKNFTNVSSSLRLDKAIHKENPYNDFNQEPLSIKMLSTESPRLCIGDVNNDKLDDFVLLGAAGDPDKLYIQTPGGYFNRSNTLPLQDSVFESTCGLFIDLNNDNNIDLIIGSGGNEPGRKKELYTLRVYLGNGRGGFKPDQSQSLENIFGNFSTIVPNDYDGDGYIDLFIGSRVIPGSFGLVPKSYLLKNIGGKLSIVERVPVSGAGMITDAGWTDFDHDGDKDLMIVGDWMPITFYVNEAGTFTNKVTVPNSYGWWNSIQIDDLDSDGDDDYVLGNWGLNTRFKASTQKPLTMYVKDFDNNGKSEFIINWYPPMNDTAYPFATKPEISQALPFLRKQNLKYETYAKKTYETLLPIELRQDALTYRTDVLQSSILWNDNGLHLEALALEAQVTPIFATAIKDFDGDGIKDIWLGGNIYGLKPQVGRSNSSQGIFLKGKSNRKFEYLKSNQIGLEIPGEIRDAQIIKVGNKPTLLIARNNSSVQAYTFSK